jgi:hypothetical protein
MLADFLMPWLYVYCDLRTNMSANLRLSCQSWIGDHDSLKEFVRPKGQSYPTGNVLIASWWKETLSRRILRFSG